MDLTDLYLGTFSQNSTINPKKNPECFQYAATVALSYEEIKWNSERVSNIKPFYK